MSMRVWFNGEPRDDVVRAIIPPSKSVSDGIGYIEVAAKHPDGSLVSVDGCIMTNTLWGKVAIE